MNNLIKVLSLAVVTAGVLAGRPAHADDDRFTLRLGAINAEGNTRISGNTEFNGETYRYESDRLDLGREVSPRVEGIFRLSERNRLLVNYFRYSKGNRYTLDSDVGFGDTTFPAGSFAKSNVAFDLGSVLYDYALVETPTVSFGLQIGAEWARLKGSVYAESGDDSFSTRASESGAAPVVGARFSTNSRDQKWGFTVQGQYLDADWGNFDDYAGDITRANALVEYRFTRNFGLYAGYDWFKLNAHKGNDDGRIGLDQRFKGPTAGITLAF